MRKFLIVLVIIGLLGGFLWKSFTQKTHAAELAIADFRAAYASGDFASIYASSHKGFKDSTAEPEFIQFMQTLKAKLGTMTSAEGSGWHVNADSKGTTVVLSFTSVFSNAPAVETFTHMMEGDRAVLYGYNVESKALVSKPEEGKPLEADPAGKTAQ